MTHTATRSHADSRGSIYRDSTDALRRELAAIERQHQETIEVLRAPAESIYAARRARQAAGWVLLGAIGLMALSGLAIFISVATQPHGYFDEYALLLTAPMLVAWPAAGLIYILTRIRARARFRYVMAAPLARTGDVHSDLDRARHFDPAQHALRLLSRLEARSMAPLLAGVTVLMPLTLHFLFGALFGVGVEQFDAWIALSAMVVGHCHLVLGVRAWRYGRRIASTGTPEIMAKRYDEGWKTYGLVVAVSLFPGLLMVCFPVLLVAVTGLYIPVVYGLAARRLSSERATVNMATLEALLTVR